MFQIQNEDKWSVNLNLTRRGAEVEGVWLTAYSIETAVTASADLKWSSDLVFQHGRTNSRQPVCDWLWIQHPDLVFKYCSLWTSRHPGQEVLAPGSGRRMTTDKGTSVRTGQFQFFCHSIKYHLRKAVEILLSMEGCEWVNVWIFARHPHYLDYMNPESMQQQWSQNRYTALRIHTHRGDINVYYPVREGPSSFALLVGKNIGFVRNFVAWRCQKIFRAKYKM